MVMVAEEEAEAALTAVVVVAARWWSCLEPVCMMAVSLRAARSRKPVGTSWINREARIYLAGPDAGSRHMSQTVRSRIKEGGLIGSPFFRFVLQQGLIASGAGGFAEEIGCRCFRDFNALREGQ